MCRFSHLLPCLLILLAPRTAEAQDAFQWLLAKPSSGYTAQADGSPLAAPGATLSLQSTSAETSSFGTVTAIMSEDSLAGRRIHISGDLETIEVSRSASLWVRADSGAKVLALDNGLEQGIIGTTTGSKHMDVMVYVPKSTTRLVFGLLLRGTGKATARNVRLVASPVIALGTPLGVEAHRELDAALDIVRRASLWRDTVTWSRVEAEVRLMAAGSESAAETYPAIRMLLTRLGDHHSFLMMPRSASAFHAGGAQNPRPEVRVQSKGIGYISVPAYGGADKAAAESYVRAVYDSLARSVASGAGTCRWIVDLRSNRGGNMWPMLGGLRPFLGKAGLGSFVSAAGSAPLWHARDVVDVAPPSILSPLDSANVAVLIGPSTASAGEAVTISFIGRPHARTFGSPTAGLSTANATNRLPDGAMILLTVAVEADRTGKRYGHAIEPDEVIPSAQNGAMDDPQLDRAITWLRAQPCPEHR